jgi:hypothetical protein
MESVWSYATSERVTGAPVDQLCQMHMAMASSRLAMRV